MIAVADSSPLIILAKLDCFDLLQNLYSDLYISGEVYSEVVVTGAGLPGSIKVADSEWVKVKPISNRSNLAALRKNSVLGVGELSTIVLAEELGAQTVLLDDYKARTLTKAEGLHVRGTVGILEALYQQQYLVDLREAFQKLLLNEVYIDRKLLNRRLESLGLLPL